MRPHEEPEYIDQVPRRAAYEALHPEVDIQYLGPFWQATVQQPHGLSVVTRDSLERLLDKLEEED